MTPGEQDDAQSSTDLTNLQLLYASPYSQPTDRKTKSQIIRQKSSTRVQLKKICEEKDKKCSEIGDNCIRHFSNKQVYN